MKINLLSTLGGFVLACSVTTHVLAGPVDSACTKRIKHYRIAKTGAGGHALVQPGTVCLQEDVFVKWNRIWVEDRLQHSSDSVVSIEANDVVLDLKGYSVTGNGGLSAAVQTIFDMNGGPIEHPPRSITIRNGKILIEHGGAGIKIIGLGGEPGIDVPQDMSDAWRIRQGRSYEKPDQEDDSLAARSFERKAKNPQPNKPSDYRDRQVLIEKLHIAIKSKEPAVMVQGAGTVIRDNVIEIDGNTALWLAGPNALVENNVLIVDGRTEPVRADAVIRIKHGDGAIIRNNKIIVRGKANKRLISTFDTAGLSVENNTIYGLESDAQLATAFLGTLQMKASGNRYEPACKALMLKDVELPKLAERLKCLF